MDDTIGDGDGNGTSSDCPGGCGADLCIDGQCTPCGSVGDDEQAHDDACMQQHPGTQCTDTHGCAQCDTHADCDSNYPACDETGQCVVCNALGLGRLDACEDRNSAAPICTPDGCRPCTQHSQCNYDWPGEGAIISACDIRNKTCFPKPDEGQTAEMGPTKVIDTQGQAVGNLPMTFSTGLQGKTHVIVNLIGDTSNDIDLNISTRTVALLGNGHSWKTSKDCAIYDCTILDISGDAMSSSLYIHGVEFGGILVGTTASSAGIRVDTRWARIDRTAIRDTPQGHGLVAGPKIEALSINNTIIGDIGSLTNPYSALELEADGEINVSYSTIVASPDLFVCDGTWDGSITNSIVGIDAASGADAASCHIGADCKFVLDTHNSLFEDECAAAGMSGSDNVVLMDAELDLDWWNCGDTNGCEFLLDVPCDHPIVGLGRWSSDETLSMDFEGTPRPAGGCSCPMGEICDFMGANIPTMHTDCNPDARRCS